MKNRIGFIPKTYPIQPDYYKNIAGDYVAVFIVDDGTTKGKEYHIQIKNDAWGNFERFWVLIQCPDCRRPILPADGQKSLIQAYTKLLPFLQPAKP